MADYATAAQIRAFAPQTQPDALGGEGADTWTTLATAASRLFDNLAEVSDGFFAAASATASNREFIGDGTAYLKLDPYTELVTVTINDGTIDDPDFTTDNVPDYVARDGMLIALDKVSPAITDLSGRFSGWPVGKQIRVSAKWGFAAIPKDVTFAVIQLALHSWRLADPAFAVLSDSDKAAQNGNIPAFAKAIAEQYRRQYSRSFVFA